MRTSFLILALLSIVILPVYAVAPVASFTGTPGTGVVPLAVTFTDTSTNSPTAWNWNFGDSTTSIQQNPVHTYNTAGTYTVTLSATNADGSNTTIDYISADFASVATFRADRRHTGTFNDGGIRPSAHLRWNFTTAWSVGSSPVIADNILYIGSDDGSLYAMNATNGSLLWNTPIGFNIVSSPAIADGVVYVGSWNKNVYALNAATGATVWTYTTGDYITSSPGVANGLVYIGSHDGNVYALNASTGIPSWTYTTGFSNVESSPAVANGIVYVGSVGSAIHALNASTGNVVWTNTTLAGQVISSPAVVNGVVYAGSFNDRMYALDAATGIILWEYTTSGSVDSSPAISGGVVYVGSDDNNLYALDAITGTKLWSFPTGGTIFSSPAVANGRVYVGSNDGSIYALNSATGSELWHYATGAGIRSSPWVADGTVFFGSDDHSVYALGGTAVPVADFTGTPASGTAPLTVTFIDTSANTPASWNWNFGDGTTSTLQNPSHTYATTGTYTVTLNATNTAGSDTRIRTNYVTISAVTQIPTQSPNGGSDSGGSAPAPAPVPGQPPGIPPGQPQPQQQPQLAPPSVEPLVPFSPETQPVEGLAGITVTESYPVGYTGMIYNTAGDNMVSVDLDAASNAGAIITRYFDRFTSYQHHSPGVLITFWGDRFEYRDGKIMGKVNRAELQTDPLTVNTTSGKVSGSVTAVLTSISKPVEVENTITGDIPPAAVMKYEALLAQDNQSLAGIAYLMKFQRANLTSTGVANVTMTVPQSWVEIHGGRDAVHITRISDDTGTTELLKTTYIGPDSGGNLIFCGDSPHGTSLFGLVTAKATAVEKKAHPNETIIPATKPAMITNVGMVGWLMTILRENPVLLVIPIAVLAAAVYFGWWRRRL